MGDCSNTAAEPNKYHLYWFCAYGGYMQFHLVSLLLTIGGHVVCVCVCVFLFFALRLRIEYVDTRKV